MIISTVYGLGDKVVAGSCVSTRHWAPCPECDGTGYHKVEGKDLRLQCTTCNKQFNWEARSGHVVVYKWTTHIEHLTVGQIRVEISHGQGERKYMCEETGISYGTIWFEEQLWGSAGLPVLRERLEKRCKALNSGEASTVTGYDSYLSWREGTR